MLDQVLMHVKGVEKQMWLVSHSLPQALKLSFVEIVLKNWPILRVGAMLDDFSGPFAWRHASDVC